MNKNTYRFSKPKRDRDGRTVYGLYENKSVYNPDFRWPVKFQRPDDVWVDGNDEIAFPAKETNR